MYDSQHRLPVVILAAIVISFMAAGTFWLAPLLIWDRDRAIAELAMDTERGIAAAQARHNAGSIAQNVALLKTVIELTPVTGVTVLSPQGRVVQNVGEALPVKSDQLRRGQLSNYQTIQGCCIDLYLKKSRTGLPYNLVARIDTGNISRSLAGRTKRLLTAGLAILALGTAVSMAVLYRFIVLPLDRLRLGLSGGSANSPAKNLPQSILARKDVIGDLGRMIDPPNGALRHGAPASATHRHEDPDLINEIPLEVLSFGADGALTDANEPALSLFHCQSLSDLRAMDLNVFQADHEPGNGPCSLPDVVQNAPLELSVMVFCGQEPVPRRVVARVDDDDQGNFQSLVVCLLPSGGAGPACVSEPVKTSAGYAAVERRAVKLKLILEACLTLMSRPDPATLAAAAQPVRTDILVENWYLDASRCSLVAKDMEHCVPGQLVGDADAVTSLIRHSLTFVALRSEAEVPRLAGSGEMQSADLAEFVIEEVGGPPVRDQETGEAGSLQQDESRLPLAALTSLLAAYGGKILALRGDDDTNLIRFVMRARPSGTGSAEEGKTVANIGKSAA